MIFGLIVVILVSFGVVTWLLVARQMRTYSRDQDHWAERGPEQPPTRSVVISSELPEPTRVRRPAPSESTEAKQPSSWLYELWWDD